MVRLVDVFKRYPNGTDALRGISFSLADGDFAFLVGPSGSGKSTIIKLLTGEISPTDGSVMVNGYDAARIRIRQLPYLRRSVGVVFQDFRLIESKTVYENAAFAMRAVGAAKKDISLRIPYVLNLVGLEDKAKAFPAELSGGEQQRVAIARALVNNPGLIIADEPTGNLDPARSLEILTLLKKINDLKTTMLIVTHEKSVVDRLGGRIIALNKGTVVFDGEGRYDEIYGE